MVTIRRLFLIVPLLLGLVLSGCQNAFGFINAKWITEISLSQHRVGQEQQDPIQAKVYTEAAFIKTMAQAMNTSKKLSGELDYEPEFDMVLTYGDGYTEQYYLALGEQKGYNGLLVSAENSGKGYSIPVKNSDILRDLISGSSDTTGATSVDAKVSVTGPMTLSHNDFTIGQYGSSNNSIYKLFTFGKDNAIDELRVEPEAELVISSPERYSVMLDRVDEHSFKTSFYDNAVGKQAESVFQWDGTSFQKLNK
ncbi:hypothetical protein [Paenibacillus monticola]|uniref:hypothetical protein n=1 Tax=Paenibacillus monticola TaxID=2666075 RepID=UPI001E48B94B|nr:hypothetical protein [Paenibacillus monticola]